MPRGRKPNRALREAKTDPAKRRKVAPAPAPKRARKLTPVELAEQRASLAQQRAQQFVAGQKTAAMPDFFASDAQYAGAAAIWAMYEPLLRERHFWEPQFVVAFTGFCVYADEFLAADREVKAKGWGVEGKSTSGGNRFWKNPAVDVRDHAFARVLELSARFGFTTVDLYKLERESAAAVSSRPQRPGDPGAGDEQQLPLADQAQDAPAAAGPGALTAFDSAPPQQLN